MADEHPDLAFDFAIAHRAQVEALVDASGRARSTRACGASSDPAMVGKLEAYHQRHIAPSSRQSADNAIAQVKMRSAFARDGLGAVDRWLETQAP